MLVGMVPPHPWRSGVAQGPLLGSVIPGTAPVTEVIRGASEVRMPVAYAVHQMSPLGVDRGGRHNIAHTIGTSIPWAI